MGTADDLDIINRIHVESQLRSRQRGIVEIVVQNVAIQQEENTIVVVAGDAEAANPDVGVIPVVGSVKARNASQRFIQGSIPETPDVFGRNDGNRGRRLV
jgi:hypothetical protein